jgi:TPR repeat protein
MAAHLQEAAIENAILTDENRLHCCLHVVVDAALAYALEQSEGSVVGVEHHRQGVPQDYVIAHMWLSLAAAGGNFTAERDFIAAKMTPAQVAEAQKLAREWKPTTGR